MNVSPATPSAPRVLIVSSSAPIVPGTSEPAGLYLTELATPFHTLRDRGARVDVATIGGGMPPFEPNSVNDPEEQAVLAGEELNRALSTAPALRDVDTSQYDAILLAGGQGALVDYPTEPAVAQAVAGVYERGGIVGAICHGSNGLADVMIDGVPLVRGKVVTGFPSSQDKLSEQPGMAPKMTEARHRAAGAIFEHEGPRDSHVAIDGRLITGQNPSSAQAFADAVAGALGL